MLIDRIEKYELLKMTDKHWNLQSNVQQDEYT